MDLKFNILLSLCLLFIGLLPAQTPIPAEVQTELDARNIDETELRRRLLDRGIDLDAVTPEQLPALQAEIEAVVAELEAEAAGSSSDTLAPVTDLSDTAASPPLTPGTPTEGAPAVAPVQSGPLPIYGHSIFSDGNLIVQSGTVDVKPPDSYLLGVGDELVVSIFGRSQADLQFTIGTDGYIRPARMPRIYLKGLPLGQARELVARRFGQYYVFEAGQFALTVSQARTITVNVFGELVNSGSYNLSALNTAFNALVAAGGPNAQGTVRQIRLIRGEEVRSIDVYEYLENPARAADFGLENNDVVFVQPADILVEITGAVRRPQRYELLEAEGLEELIDFAGGLANNALDGRGRITRLENGVESVLDFRGSNPPELKAGDVIEILAVNNPILEFVAVEGEVDLPGRYGFEEGMRVSYLIDQGRLRPTSRRDLAFLLRVNPDGTRGLLQLNPMEIMANPGGEADLLLQNADRLQVFASRQFVDESFISVVGSVREALDSFPYPSDQAMTLSEAILLAGGLRTNAASKGFIIRSDVSNNNRRAYLEVDLAEAVADPSSAANIVLQPFDQVVVYEQERFEDVFEVSISGAVREAGTYTYDPSLGVSELIRLAGGFRLDAATNRIEVFRLEYNRNNATRTVVATLEIDENLQLVSPADFVLQPFDQVMVRSVSEFEEIRTVTISGEVAYPGEYALLKDNERISDLISRSGGLTNESYAAGATMFRQADGFGTVVLNLDEVMDNRANPSNMVLREGDQINVPKRQDLVTILIAGTRAQMMVAPEVIADGRLVVAYQGERPIDWYVEHFAGGYDRQVARRRWTTIRYLNGQVQEIRDSPMVRPGSTISVGLKPVRPERNPDEPRTNWSEVTQTAVAGLTGLVTLLVLIDRL